MDTTREQQEQRRSQVTATCNYLHHAACLSRQMSVARVLAPRRGKRRSTRRVSAQAIYTTARCGGAAAYRVSRRDYRSREFASSCIFSTKYSVRYAVNDQARHRWIAAHILPHEGEVRGWLRRYARTLRTADVDDLIQEAYARLWAVDFSTIGNGRSYFYTIVRNLLLEHVRRARIVPMERLGEIEALRIPSDEPGLERQVTARQELERLERIVDGLPEQCAQAFRLQKFRGLSQREIAAAMGLSEKTVEKHLANALVRVLKSITQEADLGVKRARAGGHAGREKRD